MAGHALALPENVIAVSSAPHASVFPHAAAVVTHAGHGTVMRALSAGLPLLCLPMGRDQDDNAARVGFAGAGLRLRPSASATRIAAAVRRLLEEPRYRVAAEEIGQTITRDAPAHRATAELEALAARRNLAEPIELA
jgi:UDP:flavonoid glycosyltransferase YjiC (YdhE family)